MLNNVFNLIKAPVHVFPVIYCAFDSTIICKSLRPPSKKKIEISETYALSLIEAVSNKKEGILIEKLPSFAKV